MRPKRTERKRRRNLEGFAGNGFFREKCAKSNDILNLVEYNAVSISVPGPCTHHDVVEAIASCAAIPIDIESLCTSLRGTESVRGVVCFGYVGKLLDQIAANFTNMRWWISAKGLNMATVLPAPLLSPFDELAGKLMIDSWNGGLSENALWSIAKKLDG